MSPAELIACLRQVPLTNESPSQQGQERISCAIIIMSSPLYFFLNRDKLTMTQVEETSLPFMICLRGRGMKEVGFPFFFLWCAAVIPLGLCPRPRGFSLWFPGSDLLPPSTVYHISSYDKIPRLHVILCRLYRHLCSAVRHYTSVFAVFLGWR